MIAQSPGGSNPHIRADETELFPQHRHIDLHMVLHRVGFQSPYMGKDGGFGQVPSAGLQQQTHDIKFPGTQPDAAALTEQRAGSQIQHSIAERHFVDLSGLAAQQCIDAGKQLARIKGLAQVIIRAGIVALKT